MTPLPYVLALHGGAGTIAARSGASERPYREALLAALACGERVLAAGGSAVDAVAVTTIALEDCPLFNAGHGSVYTADELHELDAGIMDGHSLAAGAVACARRIRNPVNAARAVMQQGRSVLLVAEGADRFAAEHGLPLVDPAYYGTPHRHAQLRAVRARNAAHQVLDHDGAALAGAHEGRYGTVGAVAMDRHGHLAAATSTGGMTNKQPGRVGDTPVPGCGVYANDATCAVSATGTGEHFLRASAAYDVHARLRYLGQPLDQAVAATIEEGIAPLGGSGGLIAIDRSGALSLRFNSAGLYRAWVREGQDPMAAIFES
jgi:beta-aspartyl-peptidase (threonine type)